MDEVNSRSLAEALEEFRTVLKGVKNLTVPTDDAYLTRFILARKLNVDEAVVLIKKYFEMKKLYDNLSHIRISEYKAVYNTKFQTVLKHRDSQGRKILYLRTRFWNISEHNWDMISMSTFFILHEMTAEKETQTNGMIVVLDNAGLTFSDTSSILATFSINEIKRIIMFLQGSYPLRCKGIHIVSTPYVLEKLANVFKFFLKRKMRNRLYIHGNNNFKSLHKEINSEILPKSLGGQIADDECEDIDLMESLYSKEQYYHDHWKCGFTDSN